MTFDIVPGETETRVRIEGELDAVTVSEIRPAFDQLITSRPHRVVIDVSSLRMIDSTGVGALVSAYKRVRAQGGDVLVSGLRDQPLAIFRLLRLDRVLAASPAVDGRSATERG